MPINDSDFAPIVLPNDNKTFTKYYIHVTSGTFNVEPKLNGTVTTDQITTVGDGDLAHPIEYSGEDRDRITVHVNSSSGCVKFEMIIW